MTGASAAGGTFTGSVATFANRIGNIHSRQYPNLLATSTKKKKKKKKK